MGRASRIKRMRACIFGRTTMLRKFLGVAMISAAVLVSACNTVEGAGRDVQSAGAAVEDAAD